MSAHFKAEKRLAKELADIRGRVFTDDLPFYAVPRPGQHTRWDVLIVGPHDTPYSGGFFVFSWDFATSSWPFHPPKVRIVSTDAGRVRFNPNLYAEGKVCLSYLGTWGNDWTAAITSEKVIEAIRGLVMTAEPYYNEPGFEKGSKGSDAAQVQSYSDKIAHETMRVGVVQAVESLFLPGAAAPPAAARCKGAAPAAAAPAANVYEPFRFEVRSLFRLWFAAHRSACVAALQKSPDGADFRISPFEGGGNEARGKFHYGSLVQRLDAVAAALHAQEAAWRAMQPVRTVSDLDPAIADEPSCYWWHCQIHGAITVPAACADVVITVEVLYDPANRSRRPTVRLTSPTHLFHPNVSEDGVVYWFAHENRTPDATRHALVHVMAGVKVALAAPSEAASGVWVNPAAGKLYFSTATTDKAAFSAKVEASLVGLPRLPPSSPAPTTPLTTSKLPEKRPREEFVIE